MKFFYKAYGRNGRMISGFLEAKSQKDAATMLRSQELSPIKIVEQVDHKIKLFGRRPGGMTQKELIFFTRQLASMLNSGLTLMQSLNILKEQVDRQAARDVVNGIITEIEGGSSLSDAISKHPSSFSEIYISLVRTSESSGFLDKVMDRLATNLEKAAALRSQIVSAMIYPAIIVLMMLGVMGIMVFFVIPQISVLYESLDIDLPFATKVMLGISHFILTFWPLMLVGFVAIPILFRYLSRKDTSRFALDALRLRIPILGKLTSEGIFAEFTRTFAILVGSGNVVVESLRKAATITGNIVYKTEIDAVAERVEKGVSIGDAMSASSYFPLYLVQIIKIGEQTGKLDESLVRASEYYEREVAQTVKRLTTAMEPLIMVILGIGVGLLLFSVITPIYKITSSI